jgi:hypothetical protein
LGKEQERTLLRDSIVGAGRYDLDMKKTPRRRLLDGVTIVKVLVAIMAGQRGKPCKYEYINFSVSKMAWSWQHSNRISRWKHTMKSIFLTKADPWQKVTKAILHPVGGIHHSYQSQMTDFLFLHLFLVSHNNGMLRTKANKRSLISLMPHSRPIQEIAVERIFNSITAKGVVLMLLPLKCVLIT